MVGIAAIWYRRVRSIGGGGMATPSSDEVLVDTRITESGDTRITEDDDTRITE